MKFEYLGNKQSRCLVVILLLFLSLAGLSKALPDEHFGDFLFDVYTDMSYRHASTDSYKDLLYPTHSHDTYRDFFGNSFLSEYRMDKTLYRYALQLALPLMLFFGFHMIFGRTPEKENFANYLRSRRLMGAALLVLAANYSVHLFYEIRLKDVNATILMNLSTYFLCYWLFSSALMTLLDSRYITRRRFIYHISMWLAFSAVSVFILIMPDYYDIRFWSILSLAAWLLVYGIILSCRLLNTYTDAVILFDNTHSDDIGSYIRWLSVLTYWAIGFGIMCGVLTFMPDESVFLWILSSIPFYIYLYCRYQDYILFYEKVEKALREDAALLEDNADKEDAKVSVDDNPQYHLDIEKRILEWIEAEGYRQPGITLNDLSVLLGTNRTYLSQYIKSVYKVSFRRWITDLRIEYAKRLIRQHPQWRVQEISESSGFHTTSHFTRMFTDKEGCSPSKWRNKR